MCDGHTEEEALRATNTGWVILLKGAKLVGTIVPPSDLPKLLFTQQAYTNLPDAKRRILFKLKQKTASQTVNDTCTEIVWFLDPSVFLEMTTEYPWLLDKNLGEPEPGQDFWGGNP
jgi:hypothetical protein